MVCSKTLVNVVFIVCVAFESADLDSSSKKTKTYHNLIPKFFKSLDKAFKYFEKEFEQVNLDAIFGLRISEGVLKNIITSMEKNRSRNVTPLSLRYYIVNLKNRATRVISQALPFLKRADENYFKDVGFVVENKWTFVEPFKRLNAKGNGSVNDREVTRRTGNSYQPCMVALSGSGGPGNKPCNVTDRCWQVMTRTDHVGYSLTHQALYFMFGKQLGCSSVLLTKLKQSNIQGGFQKLFQDICTSMYHQMEILEKVKRKTHMQTDLYLEQSVICGGLLSYSDFLTMDRLGQILKIQRPHGCFGNLIYGIKMSRIQKRRRKVMSDGCESHTTGVATALLSSYLRWLLLTQQDTIISWLNLDQERNCELDFI